jgi:hypothetical protein
MAHDIPAVFPARRSALPLDYGTPDGHALVPNPHVTDHAGSWNKKTVTSWSLTAVVTTGSSQAWC